MTISEKSAYLKGLMEGMNLNTESNEGKMIAAIVDLLGDMAKRVTDIEETTIAISDELDEIEEDLDAIEDFIMDEDDDDDEDYDDEDEWDDDEDSDEGFEFGDEETTITRRNVPAAAKWLTLTRRLWKREASFAPTAVRRWSFLWKTKKSDLTCESPA